MSEFTVVEVELKEEDVLVSALKQMGYKPVIHKEAVELQTYYQDRVKPKAHIVISKGQVGGYGAVGFERQKNGFKMHIDNMDQRRFKTGKLKQSYAEQKINKAVKRRAKFSIKSRKEEDGKIKIRLRRNF
ncbi:hypothetical protein LCGC14_0829830 [marine sediment metagenome]|uniref:Uncharacterized protein n=1 Tax=marine sediment metagenome TaxID=412755 RepID=A0A0F9SNM2_9ZZZZ